MTFQDLRNKYQDCNLCPNVLNNRKVFGCGEVNAKIAVVGEGPGEVEARTGVPFTGPAGKLLDNILLGVRIKREDVFYTNAVLCRTDSKNRTPTKSECKNCQTRLFEELSIVKPKFTLLVGSPALKTVMGDSYKIMESHGKWYTLLSEPSFNYFALMHPAWILHSISDTEAQAKKEIMWSDIKKFARDMMVIDSSFSQ